MRRCRRRRDLTGNYDSRIILCPDEWGICNSLSFSFIYIYYIYSERELKRRRRAVVLSPMIYIRNYERKTTTTPVTKTHRGCTGTERERARKRRPRATRVSKVFSGESDREWGKRRGEISRANTFKTTDLDLLQVYVQGDNRSVTETAEPVNSRRGE